MVCESQVVVCMPERECREVSALYHTVKSIRRFEPDNLFAMFTTYHDAAGGKDHGFIIVSGWLSSLVRWDRFEVDWRLLLAKYNLPYFHMKEFVQSKGPFAKNWQGNEPKRARFLAHAVSIIKSHVEYGAACFVEFDVFAKINRTYKLGEMVGVPYSLAGRDCVAHFNEYLRTRHNGVLPQIDYIFDQGDQGWGDLEKVIRRDCGRMPIARPSRDMKHKKTGDIIKGVVHLQSADFAAYELRKAMREDPREEWLPWQHRKSLQELASVPAWWGRYSEKDLVRMCKAVPIEPRRAGII